MGTRDIGLSAADIDYPPPLKASNTLLLRSASYQEAIRRKLLPDLRVIVLESVSSTIDWIKNALSMGTMDTSLPTLCLAEHQTQGRGQHHRSWYSPANQNIYLSLCWTIPFGFPETGKALAGAGEGYIPGVLRQFSGFSLFLGLITAEVLSLVSPTLDISIKWPNDVYCGGKKIAGILVESLPYIPFGFQGAGKALVGEGEGVYTEYMTEPESREQHSQNLKDEGYKANSEQTAWIISLGLNVNMTRDDSIALDIHQPWTSLQIETGNMFDRDQLVITWLKQFFERIHTFLSEGWTAFLPQWQHYDYLVGKKIALYQEQETLLGQALGIDRRGRLVLKTADGLVTRYSGQIKVIE